MQCVYFPRGAAAYRDVDKFSRRKRGNDDVTRRVHDGGRFDSSVQEAEQPNEKFP